jgi:DNA-binding PadR family transcriptional regulator
MLLIAEEPSHGYSLLDKLTEMGLVKEETDLSIIYRVLRQMEDDGLAVSDHVDEGRGPARKVYRLTDAGRDALSVWSGHLKDVDRLIGEFQGRYESLVKDE